MKRTLLPLAVLASSVCAGSQDPAPGSTGTDTAPAKAQKLAWPRDRGRTVCRIEGRDHTLEDVLNYIDGRHYPGMLEFIATPAGQLYFESPLPARWIRHYADIQALRAEAEGRGLDPAHAEDELSAALKAGFERWLAEYTDRLARQGRSGELTQGRINALLTDYQSRFGLETEVQGWLDFAVPEIAIEDNEGRLREFYDDHVPYFGGRVTMAQIMVENRDPVTGELLTGEALEQAYGKLADARSRLEDDGSNFEDVARLISDDRRTAARGGVMENVRRFDPRLPAIICRTAWHLRDGQVSEPVQSRFGLHIIKRLSYKHVYYVLFAEKLKPEIARIMREEQQEDLLFGARDARRVELLY